MHKSFELVHVYYGDVNPNRAFFAKLPEFQRFPHLYVMDVSGEILASRDASVLMQARKFDTSRISAFAARWAGAVQRVVPGVGGNAMTEEKQHVPG